MKNLLTFLVLLLAFGCGDKCEDLNCVRGNCEDGICDCPLEYTGDFCENEKTPSHIRAGGVQINITTPFDLSGNPWESDNTEVDLYFSIEHNGEAVAVGDVIPNQNFANWNFPIDFNAPTEIHTVSVFEAGTNDRFIDVIEIIPYDAGENFPDKVFKNGAFTRVEFKNLEYVY